MSVRVGVGLGRFVFGNISGFRAWLDFCEAPLNALDQSSVSTIVWTL